MSTDPWTAFLDWLTTVLVPAWGELISLLPVVLVATLVGPFVTLILLMWAWYLVKRRRGRVHRGEPPPVPAPVDAEGKPVYPPNTPYCEKHRLIFPPRARDCSLDGADLIVACPVDGSVRRAVVETCRVCGTRYKLGASAPTSVVLAPDGPPEGGAAIA